MNLIWILLAKRIRRLKSFGRKSQGILFRLENLLETIFFAFYVFQINVFHILREMKIYGGEWKFFAEVKDQKVFDL